MRKIIRRRDTGQESGPEEVSHIPASPEARAQSDELKSELDALLDEIDEVLEVDAEDFVKSYVQKGGE